MSEIESPCIKICQIDVNGICFGCRRTIHEIGDWTKYNNHEKLEVLEKAAKRKPVELTGGFSF